MNKKRKKRPQFHKNDLHLCMLVGWWMARNQCAFNEFYALAVWFNKKQHTQKSTNNSSRMGDWNGEWLLLVGLSFVSSFFIASAHACVCSSPIHYFCFSPILHAHWMWRLSHSVRSTMNFSSTSHYYHSLLTIFNSISMCISLSIPYGSGRANYAQTSEESRKREISYMFVISTIY